MEFSDNKPIYRQIVDYAYNQILESSWEPGGRVPSVRELSIELGVNARTVMKAMEELQDGEMIIPRRGMGFHVAEDARERVIAARKREFFSITLPAFAEEMRRLGITTDEILLSLSKLPLKAVSKS